MPGLLYFRLKSKYKLPPCNEVPLQGKNISLLLSSLALFCPQHAVCEGVELTIMANFLCLVKASGSLIKKLFQLFEDTVSEGISPSGF
jgi:hypothetical protein